MNDKATTFRAAFKIFIQIKEPTEQDYFNLCVQSGLAVRQGSGITWGTMKEIIDEEYLKEKYGLK